jgi:hypothetical protein
MKDNQRERLPNRRKNAIKLDELPEIERQAFEIARSNIAARERVVLPTLAQEVDRIWVARLSQRGFTADEACRIREALPDVIRLQKLLRVEKEEPR